MVLLESRDSSKKYRCRWSMIYYIVHALLFVAVLDRGRDEHKMDRDVNRTEGWTSQSRFRGSSIMRNTGVDGKEIWSQRQVEKSLGEIE